MATAPLLGSQKPSSSPNYGSISLNLVSHSPHSSNDVSVTFSPSVPSRLGPKAVNGETTTPKKLGTLSGVFVPTSLNVLSILMFLRFGFILGQAGCLGMLAMLAVCYAVDLLTTMSLSAIATNGTVRVGGTYFLISRSLGPEFGGSIGLVFYLGSVFNTGMNAVGLIDCLISVFGEHHGTILNILPEGFWVQYGYGTIVLLLCSALCMADPEFVARGSTILLIILFAATASVPISAAVVRPFIDPTLGTEFTGPSWATLGRNMYPHFTQGSPGGNPHSKESWQSLFGILFPATAGIFAGASMSGDLKDPSKSIPQGTLWGLGFTFVCYVSVILALAASVTRETLYQNLNVISDISAWSKLILAGEMATSLFSALMGLLGASQILQALAQDRIVPGLSVFSKGIGVNKKPLYGVLLSLVIAQVTMFADINQIAALATMAFLMTFLVTNLACFSLKLASAPNFRPSFRLFGLHTAGIGTLASGLTMVFVDGTYAGLCTAIVGFIFLLIHYTASPKKWGDVSQTLIYHQVRKYLLRLETTHVKYWRPQVLLLVNNRQRQGPLIQFCNSLKKGGLYILGHVLITPNFKDAVRDATGQQDEWSQYIKASKIKAFFHITVAPSMEWGVRNAVLGAGLGGMRPNIVVMGFYNLDEAAQAKDQQPEVESSRGNEHGLSASGSSSQQARQTESGMGSFASLTSSLRKAPNSISFASTAKLKEDPRSQPASPVVDRRVEGPIKATAYVRILEDLLLELHANVVIGKGFHDAPNLFHLDAPVGGDKGESCWIDLWPILMCARITTNGAGPDTQESVLTSNFDTYTLILQLGVILSTVPSWKRHHKLRVAAFVEHENQVKEEKKRLKKLLCSLRIQAEETPVEWLACGCYHTYEIIANGKGVNDGIDPKLVRSVEKALKDDRWWQTIKRFRAGHSPHSFERLVSTHPATPSTPGVSNSRMARFKIAHMSDSGRPSEAPVSAIHKLLGVSWGMSMFPSSTGVRGSILDPFANKSDESETEESDEEEASLATPNRTFPANSFNRLAHRRSSWAQGAAAAPGPKGVVRFATDAGGGPAVDSSNNLRRAQTGFSDRPGGGDEPSLIGTHQDSRARPAPVGSNSSFSSRLMPTSLYEGDEEGSRMMFSNDDPSNPTVEETTDGAETARAASHHISFEDLSSRAKHIIINEVIRTRSGDKHPFRFPSSKADEQGDKLANCPTSVIFTTLPGPAVNSSQSEEESIRYLTDLDILCQGLPPVMLVHSNSVTVTVDI